jgi:hypothetical protein
MTGINPWNRNLIDFPDSRYGKYKQIAEKFRIIQLGICTWKKVTKENSEFHYEAKPYNIYVFPEDWSGNTHINCETAAIIFNRENKMDFNKWIYKGVSYMNAKQESTQIDSATDGNLNFYNPNDKTKFKTISLTKDEDRKKYDEFCKIFSDFLYSDEKSKFFEKYPKFFIYYILNNMSENIRKRLYLSYETVEGKQVLMIQKLEEEEKKLKMEIDVGSKLKDIQRKAGVRKIYNAMLQKKSIFVGHHCVLDIMFIISHFGDALPNTLKDFKANLSKYFTAVYDTKYVFQKYYDEFKDNLKVDLQNSNLEKVYNSLKALHSEKIKIKIHDQMKDCYKDESSVYHEAAFDAYVTGCAFIWMGETLKEKLTPHSNKLYLMRSIYPCFNLVGEEFYIIPDSTAYCLKAIKQAGDIDLKLLLEEKIFSKIKKCYNLDGLNSLLILVHLETTE